MIQDKTAYEEAKRVMREMAKLPILVITEDMIKKFHGIMFETDNPEEAGVYRQVEIELPQLSYTPPKHEELPHLMEHFVSQMSLSAQMFHPVEFAAICYKRMLDISPFKEGNEEIASLLMNLILLNKGYSELEFSKEQQPEYLAALRQARGNDNANIDVFVKFVESCIS